MTEEQLLIKTIRWGIIGCGDVTEVKSGPGFQKAPDSELVAVMRRNSILAKDYAARHNVAAWYDDADALIHDPSVNAVYVATPPSSHAHYTIAALSVGKPVLVEKPMGLTTDECMRMIAVSEEKSIPLFTAYYRRALPRFLWIRQHLQEHSIGSLKSISVRFSRPPLRTDLDNNGSWRTDPAVAGDGYFYDLACHNIDLIQFLAGENISSANGSSTNRLQLYPCNDHFTAEFLFGSGLTAKGEWNFSAEENIDQTEILGSEGRVIFSTFGNAPVIVETEKERRSFDIPHPEHVHQPLIESIVNELLGRGTCDSTGRTGMNTNRIMDLITGKI